ncbi:class I SAM-dependent methyltransferase [Actinomadura violacea]|uniref:Class I SAM-dependent methyltransferase n=1 Tax=Actinomadura violacea TaxID=2819934 RepID=A0ABS3S8J2_9ACTN|nr:class I SAM-dependent methyltransferase [Actinomadura violacea]MBO2465186.1 class I SAM-dependent methyltransferase [Actinomadura violacea]
MDDWLADTRTSYDRVAAAYADQVRGAAAGHPYLRAALSLFAASARAAGDGPVADVGCGPGHITAHLHDLGVDAFGIDLSTTMIDLARREHPRLRFEVGSMTSLDVPDGSLTGLLAWQSLIHVPDDEVPAVLAHCAPAHHCSSSSTSATRSSSATTHASPHRPELRAYALPWS